jgi:hypothetical protein
MGKLYRGKRVSFSTPSEASAHRPEPVPNRRGRALAAKGRTARANAAKTFDEVDRPSATVATCEVCAFER